MKIGDSNDLTGGTGGRRPGVDPLTGRVGDDYLPSAPLPAAATLPQDAPWASATVQDATSWAPVSVSPASAPGPGGNGEGVAGSRSRTAEALSLVPTWWRAARRSRGAIAAGSAALGAAAALLLSGAAGDHGGHPGFGPRPHLGSAFSDAPGDRGPRP